MGQAMVWRRMNQVLGPSCVLRLPNGRRLRQTGFGVMKSGWLLTIGMNSAAQVYQHYLAQVRSNAPPRLLWTCGDDIVMQTPTLAYLIHLSFTGCVLKHVLPRAEFMGQRFEPGNVLQPLYPDRHAYSMAYFDPLNFKELAVGLLSWYSLARDRRVVQPLESYSPHTRDVYTWWAYGLLELSQ